MYNKLQSDDKLRVDLADNKSNPAFKYNRERSMPFAKVIGKRGFFLFPSENSYDRFKQNKFDFEPLEEEGVGIPLLRIKKTYAIIGSFSGNAPVYVIYKYMILNQDEPPPSDQFEVIKQGNGLKLYKFPYCEIYRRVELRNIEYKLVFAFDGSQTKHLTMVRRSYNRDLFSSLNQTNIRWHVSYSPIHDDQYRLAILDESFPSLLDDTETRRTKKKLKNNKEEIQTIANYTRKFRDILPKIVSKEATLIIGEWSDSPSYGISSIPWDTQALACQGLLINYMEYERRKERESKNSQNSQLN